MLLPSSPVVAPHSRHGETLSLRLCGRRLPLFELLSLLLPLTEPDCDADSVIDVLSLNDNEPVPPRDSDSDREAD